MIGGLRCLLIRSPEHDAPVAFLVLPGLYLPRPATHRAILDIGLHTVAAFVDDDVHGLAAIGTGRGNRLGHGASRGKS